MGAWGTGIYQNDMGIEVKDDYKNKLRAGKTDEVAYAEIMQEYRAIIADEDDKTDVILALADTMWNLGRLKAEVKEKALSLIEEECVEEKWDSQKDIIRRKKVLETLKKKLLSEMGEKKKISIHKPYVTSWNPGDIYTMEIVAPPETVAEYKGWYIVIYVKEIKGFDFVVPGVDDICPSVYIMLSPKEVKSMEDITSLNCCCSVRDAQTRKKRYQYTIAETSDRRKPKNLNYLGRCDCFKYPVDEEEYDEMGSLIMWNDFVEDSIEGYKLSMRTW